MKISYRREMKHNYLIIDPEALIWRDYECRMLAGNQIDGILQLQLRQVDDEIRFYYEITSRQPLRRMLENHQLRESEIRDLILGISGILDRMEQYLLRESCVLLDPEYIYADPESFRIWLCLVPGLERDFPEDYSRFLEYLLGKVDHQDKNAVVLAYGLYQETRKENYGMEDILRLLCMEEEKKPEETCMVPIKEELPEPRCIGKKECDDNSETEGRKSHESRKGGFWTNIRCWLKRRSQRSPVSDQDHREVVAWKEIFQEEMEPIQYERAVIEKEEKSEEPNRNDRNTTLLTDLSREGVSDMRRLRALDSMLDDIPVAYFPFIIGKQEHLADFILKKDTVSRLHVRIDQTADGWSIQDLNSTNGTMVCGRMLENNEAAELHIGDEIRIAEFSYRFE